MSHKMEIYMAQIIMLSSLYVTLNSISDNKMIHAHKILISIVNDLLSIISQNDPVTRNLLCSASNSICYHTFH